MSIQDKSPFKNGQNPRFTIISSISFNKRQEEEEYYKNSSNRNFLFPFTDSELAFVSDFEKSVNLFEKKEIKIDISNFIISSDGKCKISVRIPDERSLRLAIKSAKKKELMNKAIIVARYSWLKRNKLPIPTDMHLANLCLQIKEGKLIRAYYANTLIHLPKKINYHFQIIN